MNDVFRVVLFKLSIAWLVTTTFIGLWHMVARLDLFVPAMTIALASGVISLMALMPGALAPRQGKDRSLQTSDSVDLGQGSNSGQHGATEIITACLAATAIRASSTVALFVACRYQMGLSLEMIAIYVCGWYAWLTAIEVALLADGASKLAGNRSRLTLTSARTACSETTL